MSTQAADLLRTWFLEQALPLWSCYGVDHKDGGFYEELDHTKSAIIKPRRTRLVSRQIYMFAVGGQLGWSGRQEGVRMDDFPYRSQEDRKSWKSRG